MRVHFQQRPSVPQTSQPPSPLISRVPLLYVSDVNLLLLQGFKPSSNPRPNGWETQELCFGLPLHCGCQTHNQSKMWSGMKAYSLQWSFCHWKWRGMFRKVFCSSQFLLAQRVLSTGCLYSPFYYKNLIPSHDLQQFILTNQQLQIFWQSKLRYCLPLGTVHNQFMALW